MARGFDNFLARGPKRRRGLIPFAGRRAYRRGPFSLKNIFSGLDARIPTIDEEKEIDILERKFFRNEEKEITIPEDHFLLDLRRSDLPGEYSVVSARTEISDVDFSADGSLKYVQRPSAITLVYHQGQLLPELSDGFSFRANRLYESAYLSEKERKLSLLEKTFPGLRHRRLVSRVKRAIA